MLRRVKNWWGRLAAALVVAFSLMGMVIFNAPHLSAQPATVSDDALLTAETGFTPEVIQQLLVARGSPLAEYHETLAEQTLSAAELFWIAAQHADYGLSPKALLATLQVEDGLNWPQSDGLYTHLKQIALELQRGYQAALAPTPAADGAKSAALPGEGQTAASYALARYLAPRAKVAGQVRASLQDWTAAYRQLFGKDPAKEVSAKTIATNVPFMRLPFDDPPGSFFAIEAYFDHAYPGQLEEPNLLRSDGKAIPGAHYTGCWQAMSCYSGHNATDFTMPSGTPLYAVAAGRVNYRLDVEGGLVIDHANGYRSIYWHMDKIIVNWNQEVKDGQLIGWSDNRGTSSRPHLHFGLRLVALSQDVDPFGWWSSSPDPVPGPSQFMWRGGLLADNRTAQMRLFYNQYWMRDTQGYGGESWYTRASDTAGSSTNWGMWGTTLPSAGKYTVSAYWPKNAENTTAAVYQVWHAGGMSRVVANQRADGNRFVSLGTFDFNAGPIVVILTDLTPNAPKDLRVYFDAMRWEPTERHFYVPYLRSDGSDAPPTPTFSK